MMHIVNMVLVNVTHRKRWRKERFSRGKVMVNTGKLLKETSLGRLLEAKKSYAIFTTVNSTDASKLAGIIHLYL